MNSELTAGYALTGRSPSSRARRLETAEAGAVTVVPIGVQGHDALRHYTAATADEHWTVYGNGEQVAEVADRLAKGSTPGDALDGLAYEPDPPIFTPRITAVVDRARGWLGRKVGDVGARHLDNPIRGMGITGGSCAAWRG